MSDVNLEWKITKKKKSKQELISNYTMLDTSQFAIILWQTS